MEKRKLMKIIATFIYAAVILGAGWYEDAQGYDWWLVWTVGIIFLALLCMSAGGIFRKTNYVSDSMRYRQYQKYEKNEGSISEVFFYIALMLPLIYNMM